MVHYVVVWEVKLLENRDIMGTGINEKIWTLLKIFYGISDLDIKKNLNIKKIDIKNS